MSEMRYQMAQPIFPDESIPDLLDEFSKILRGEKPLSQARNVCEFEKQFSVYSNCQFAVATHTCSAALEIALRCLDVEKDDEVIVPVETFIATAASILREGAKPVFAGINPDTFCLSLDEVKRLHSERTKAVIIVHFAGLISPEIFAISEYCKKHNIVLIEDAAHAPGACIDGRKSGSIGDMGCFSFFPTKVITTAEGGMLTTNNEIFYQKANSYRHRGKDMKNQAEIYSELGTNCRMTEFSALLGISQLKYIDSFIAERNRVALTYKEKLMVLEEKNWIETLPLPSNGRHSYWRFVVKLNSKFKREELQSKLLQEGIPIDWAYCPPVHLQPVFQKRLGTKEGLLPETETLMSHFFCLPIHPKISDQDVLDICSALTRVLSTINAKGIEVE